MLLGEWIALLRQKPLDFQADLTMELMSCCDGTSTKVIVASTEWIFVPYATQGPLGWTAMSAPTGTQCRVCPPLNIVKIWRFCGAGPGSHWCGNVGRSHASNNVHYVAHLRDGRFAQKCHDPDCAGYRSPWAPLPPQLCLKPQGG